MFKYNQKSPPASEGEALRKENAELRNRVAELEDVLAVLFSMLSGQLEELERMVAAARIKPHPLLHEYMLGKARVEDRTESLI
jgi:hypothetical protein